MKDAAKTVQASAMNVAGAKTVRSMAVYVLMGLLFVRGLRTSIGKVVWACEALVDATLSCEAFMLESMLCCLLLAFVYYLNLYGEN